MKATQSLAVLLTLAIFTLLNIGSSAPCPDPAPQRSANSSNAIDNSIRVGGDPTKAPEKKEEGHDHDDHGGEKPTVTVASPTKAVPVTTTKAAEKKEDGHDQDHSADGKAIANSIRVRHVGSPPTRRVGGDQTKAPEKKEEGHDHDDHGGEKPTVTVASPTKAVSVTTTKAAEKKKDGHDHDHSAAGNAIANSIRVGGDATKAPEKKEEGHDHDHGEEKPAVTVASPTKAGSVTTTKAAKKKENGHDHDHDHGEEKPKVTVASPTKAGSVTTTKAAKKKEDGHDHDHAASGCFPSASTIHLEDGRKIRMDELSVGDAVLTGEGRYSPVFIFTHKQVETTSSFVRIVTASGERVTATAGHYLMVNGAMLAAGSVREGDMMRLGNGLATAVVAVAKGVSSKGLFNPITLHGSIVVDGLVASTYTTRMAPDTSHMLLAPLRKVFAWAGVDISFGSLEGGMSVAGVDSILTKGSPVTV